MPPEPNRLFRLPAQPATGPSGHTRGPTLLLAAAMLGWLLVTFILGASAGFGSSQTAAGQVPVGGGVAVSPAEGWARTNNSVILGSSGVVYSRGGVFVVFAGGGYEGTAQTLMDTELAQVGGKLSSFNELTVAPISTQQGLQALSVQFSGISQGGRVEGRLYAVAARGTGFLALVLAPAGQLRSAQGDANQMIRSVVIP